MKAKNQPHRKSKTSQKGSPKVAQKTTQAKTRAAKTSARKRPATPAIVDVLEVGAIVTWQSQARGEWKKKTGTVIEVVMAGDPPESKIGSHSVRDHISYVVEVKPPARSKKAPTIYWPRAAQLKIVARGATAPSATSPAKAASAEQTSEEPSISVETALSYAEVESPPSTRGQVAAPMEESEDLSETSVEVSAEALDEVPAEVSDDNPIDGDLPDDRECIDEDGDGDGDGDDGDGYGDDGDDGDDGDGDGDDGDGDGDDGDDGDDDLADAS